MTNLAIFDLDRTLITCDSDVAWAAYLADKGVFNEDDSKKRDQFYDDYDNGCLDIDAFLRFQLAPLGKFSRSELDRMHAEFMDKYIVHHITKTAKNIVKKHIDNNDTVVLVSATNEFVITPIAAQFGIHNVVGVRLVIDQNGNYTGEYTGTPSFREGKIVRLQEWLANNGKTMQDYDRSFFYSDSHNDLPLLRLVDCPVAVNPDPLLRQEATDKGWTIIQFTE
ncbi:MAG: HAD family hydrolase [Neisseriaceae bacterium]|nr:HAD family hydrolase [Neisseriaceae bacterium]